MGINKKEATTTAIITGITTFIITSPFYYIFPVSSGMQSIITTLAVIIGITISHFYLKK